MAWMERTVKEIVIRRQLYPQQICNNLIFTSTVKVSPSIHFPPPAPPPPPPSRIIFLKTSRVETEDTLNFLIERSWNVISTVFQNTLRMFPGYFLKVLRFSHVIFKLLKYFSYKQSSSFHIFDGKRKEKRRNELYFFGNWFFPSPALYRNIISKWRQTLSHLTLIDLMAHHIRNPLTKMPKDEVKMSNEGEMHFAITNGSMAVGYVLAGIFGSFNGKQA